MLYINNNTPVSGHFYLRLPPGESPPPHSLYQNAVKYKSKNVFRGVLFGNRFREKRRKAYKR